MKNYDLIDSPESVTTKLYVDSRIAVQDAQPTDGAELWVDTDDMGSNPQVPGLNLFYGGPGGIASGVTRMTYAFTTTMYGGWAVNAGGVYQVPVAGRYLVAIACNLGVSRAGTLGWGRWASADFWGGQALGNANVGCRPVMSYVYWHNAATDYCGWILPDAACNISEVQISVTWVGGA